MANVQPENGCVAIAHDLYLAIARGGFTTIENGVIAAVVYLTYGAGKSKAEISTEDIRYLLGAGDSLRTDRLNEAITRLLSRRILFRQELSNGKQLLAVQKDYDLWTDKLSPTLQGVCLEINNNNPERVPDKLSPMEALTPPEKLLDYAQKASKFRYGIGAWRAERKQARLLYTEVLARTKNGDEAYQLITDYIDQDEWMRLNVKMQFTYMSSRFEAWRSQIPRKPREIRENEEAMGRPYRYDVKLKQWRVR